MRTRQIILVFSILWLFCIPACRRACREETETGTFPSLRDAVQSADDTYSARQTYENLFTHLGKRRLYELTTDEDVGIALQAAWEINKVPVERSVEISGRTDWDLDSRFVHRFLGFVEGRVQTHIPLW